MPHRQVDPDGAIRKTLEYLGDEVRLARLERGLSQAALAEWSGISQSTVSRFERGLTPGTDLITLGRLLHALGCRAILRPNDEGARRRGW